MAMKMENVTGAKLVHNGTTYNMVEAKFNGTIVWPLSVTVSYRVTSANLVFYRNGQEIYTYDYIPADGSVYAKVFGDVAVYENNVYKRTLEWVQLNVRISSGTNLYVSDNEIHGQDWATTESSEQSASVMASYETSMAVSAGTITQEANVKSASGSPVYGEKDYDYEHQQRSNPYGYHVELTAGNYSSPSAAASAGAHTTSLSVSNAYHWEDVSTPYTQTVTQNYTYTARPGQTFPESTTISDTEVAPERVSDSVTPEKVSGDSAITLSGLTVTIPSRGTVLGNARSATFRATNGTASSDVTIYQAANTRTTAYTYEREIEIQHTGDMPASAAIYSVTYSSYRTLTYTYSSGETETGTKEAYAATIAGTNCTPSTSSVSGAGAFTIEVDANASTTQTKTVSVSLTSGGTTVSDSRTQSASVPTSQNVATFKPFIFPYNAGPYLKGKVYYQFLIESGSVTSSTITGLNFRYQVNGGTKQTVQIGSFLAEEHTDPTALEPQGVTIPTFSSGTIKCWFEVTGSKGSFDVINADEDTYYYETTL